MEKGHAVCIDIFSLRFRNFSKRGQRRVIASFKKRIGVPTSDQITSVASAPKLEFGQSWLEIYQSRAFLQPDSCKFCLVKFPRSYNYSVTDK